jgi:hypothetical protein
MAGSRVITFRESEFQTMVLALGYAAGAAHGREERGLWIEFLRLANLVNRDNPTWTPYVIPEEEPYA